jgi:hypothetical protein
MFYVEFKVQDKNYWMCLYKEKPSEIDAGRSHSDSKHGPSLVINGFIFANLEGLWMYGVLNESILVHGDVIIIYYIKLLSDRCITLGRYFSILLKSPSLISSR